MKPRVFTGGSGGTINGLHRANLKPVFVAPLHVMGHNEINWGYRYAASAEFPSYCCCPLIPGQALWG